MQHLDFLQGSELELIVHSCTHAHTHVYFYIHKDADKGIVYFAFLHEHRNDCILMM